MDIKSKIESLMPGAWPIVICLGSPALSAALYKFYPDLPATWLPQVEAERFLIRILLSGSILLLGSVSLVILLIYHYRKIHSELAKIKSENKAFFHQVSSLSTDKNTLQTLLDELRPHAADVQKELTRLIADHNDLTQRNAGTVQLALMRGRALEQCEKELEEMKKSPSQSDPPQRSFPGVRIPFGNQFHQENRDGSEVALLKKELAIHKKYLKRYAPAGFDIEHAEEYEKGWNEAEKHLEE